MTATALEAPELAVNCWFNTDRPLNLAGLRGRVVALIAFQALCPQSVAVAIPQAKRIHETFEPNDATLKAFIQEYRLKFPIALDSANTAGPIPQTMDRYNMRGTPSLVLIDRQGLIRKHAFGPAEDLRIGAEIGALAAENSAVARAAQSSAAESMPEGESNPDARTRGDRLGVPHERLETPLR
jgi:hypothetical protein